MLLWSVHLFNELYLTTYWFSVPLLRISNWLLDSTDPLSRPLLHTGGGPAHEHAISNEHRPRVWSKAVTPLLFHAGQVTQLFEPQFL